MRLAVGLGNMGSRYARTRHNVGFMVLDELARDNGAIWHTEPKLKADLTQITIDGDTVILAKPTTMMNLSGESVQRIVQQYKLSPQDVLAVYDDVDTPFGRVRTRRGGSGGGHQGVNSMIAHIGTDFLRFKVGISLNDRAVEPSEVYVLKPFNDAEAADLPRLLHAAAEALKSTISDQTSEPATLTLLS